jgi:F0F1-type ATP synthase membrane subunit a
MDYSHSTEDKKIMNNPNEEHIEKSSSLLAISLRKFFNFLGFSGVIFIIYGVTSRGTHSVWPVLEKWVNPISAFLTILAVLITAVSIYFYKPYIHPPVC